jgi:hypothetical protein
MTIRASAPAHVDPLAPNSATPLRLRSHLLMQPTADVLAGVFTTAFYTNVDGRPLDVLHRVLPLSLSGVTNLRPHPFTRSPLFVSVSGIL